MIVGAVQIAHIPILPGVAAFSRGEPIAPEGTELLERMLEIMRRDIELMEVMRGRVAECNPEVIVFFDSDHLNTFFLNHVPSIAVGVDRVTSGPSDHPLEHPHYAEIPLDEPLGDAIHRGLIARQFDASRACRFTLDHSTTVPLHFATPEMDVPLVPVWINGLGGVPILAQRARALGDAIRAILDEEAGQRRVLLLSSGAISVDIGTPRSWPGGVFAVPDPEWAQRAARLIAAGDLDTLVAEATPERFANAGNASAELLNLIAVMGALGGSPVPQLAELQPTHGHIYAAWSA